ncbi:MAG TPA: hypothetical protein VF600_02185 [Abditibacteriaceae bacterium]|jgi:hypothetical protein
MRHTRHGVPVFLALAVHLCGLPSVTAATAIDGQEPAAEYVLEIDGKARPVALNKEFRVPVNAGNARMKLSLRPLRTFNKSGVRFQYPTQYTFEADTSDPTVTHWAVSGNNSILMLHRFEKVEASAALQAVTSELVSQFGKSNVKVNAVSMVLDRRKVAGKRLNVMLAGQKVVQEVFAFSNRESTFVLIVQDTTQDNGKETPETTRLKKLLAASLRFNG